MDGRQVHALIIEQHYGRLSFARHEIEQPHVLIAHRLNAINQKQNDIAVANGAGGSLDQFEIGGACGASI